MSKRRMFSHSIVESDVFMDMPQTSQNLYFHLCMNADDDGFVSPKRTMRMVGANHDDLQVLISKRYILLFDSGVAVIKHWQINNLIRQDRYTKTTYTLELQTLTKNHFGAYTEVDKMTSKEIAEITTTVNELTDEDNQKGTNGKPNVIPKVNPGKVRLGKVSNSTNVLVNQDDSRIDNARKLFQLLVKELGFTDKVRPTEGRIRKLRMRLKTYKATELMESAKHLGSDGFMQGDNDGGKRYGTIDYLLRNDENIDKYLNMGSEKNGGNLAEEMKSGKFN